MKTQQLKMLAKESALTTDASKTYIKFMKLRFPREMDENYAGEWAERFGKGTDWIYGDSKSRKILIKIKRRNRKGELLD